MRSVTPVTGGRPEPRRGRGGTWLVWGLVFLLAALHHDFWWWDDGTLVFGVVPISLAWHMVFSVCAGLIWLLAVKLSWPTNVEEWANGEGLEQ